MNELFEYMLPRYPTYFLNEPENIEECMPLARHIVAKPRMRTRARTFGGTFSKGDTILIPVTQFQNKMVLEAIIAAFEEAGAKKVVTTTSEEGVTDSHEGWRETASVKGGDWCGTRPKTVALKKYLEEHPEINIAYYGTGGEQHTRRHLGEQGKKYKGFWQFRTMEEFLWRFTNFPETIQMAAEKQMVELLCMASDVRITDPAGTDLRFSIPEAVSQLWRKPLSVPNHLMAYPPMAFRMPDGGLPYDDYVKYSTPVWKSTEGVVVACSGHVGFFQELKLHFERGIVRKVEGEGKAADNWRKNIEKWGDVQYPGHPEPSYLYHVDIAIATNPKAFRGQKIWKLGPMGETRRAGVMHMGFGIEHPDPEFGKMVQDEKIPGKHGSHVHIYFPTYEIKLRSNGKWVKIIDKGWITAYNNPDIRRLASAYGDPDSILSYDWVPPIPGVNIRGDYEDYARDPASWAERELNLEFIVGKKFRTL